MPSVSERCWLLLFHQKGEHATHPIVRFSGRLESLLRLVWNDHAALSRLATQPEKRTLGRVQLRNLGLLVICRIRETELWEGALARDAVFAMEPLCRGLKPYLYTQIVLPSPACGLAYAHMSFSPTVF